MKKKKQRLTVGPFVDWLVKYLPKCVYPQRKDYSTMNLGTKQRNYVLKQYGYKNYKEYLASEQWAVIRAKVLKEVKCVCGNRPNQVHHKAYTEANLMGATLRGLIAICHDCHYDIEFEENRKNCLGQANHKLKLQQFESVSHLPPPTEQEIKLFLSGKGGRLQNDRQLVVRRHLTLDSKEERTGNYQGGPVEKEGMQKDRYDYAPNELLPQDTPRGTPPMPPPPETPKD